MKNTHPDQDETETRLSKIEANEMRPRLKIFHPRRDNLQNFERDQDETENLGTFSLKTETRPRLSPISERRLIQKHKFVVVCFLKPSYCKPWILEMK